MILHLIKKDFLLAKRYILFIMGIIILVPVFIALRAPEIMGAGAFFLTVMYAELMLGQQISMTELKYPKAEALLCSSPYSRSSIVMAKYIFFLLIFAGCCILYGIISLTVPQMDLSVGAVMTALSVNAVIYGIYTPFQYKLGIEKTKFVFMAILMAVSFGAPLIIILIAKIDLSPLAGIPVAGLWAAMAFASAAVLAVSAWVSVRAYAKREL
jgi:ABC-2 type transport system permease protein